MGFAMVFGLDFTIWSTQRNYIGRSRYRQRGLDSTETYSYFPILGVVVADLENCHNRTLGYLQHDLPQHHL